MVTRFYLPSSGAAAVSPGFDTEWDNTGSADRIACVTTPSSTSPAVKDVAESSATPNLDILLRQYVSDQINAQTVSGTVKGQILARESGSLGDLRSQMVIKIVSADGSTVRGVLLAADTNTSLTNEWTTGASTYTNTKFPNGWAGAGAALSSVAASAGDRIVIEIGYRAHNSSSSGFTGGILCNDTAADSDLTEGGSEADTLTTPDFRSWIEFSADITFGTGGGSAVPVFYHHLQQQGIA